MFGGTFDPDLSMPALFACVCAVGIAVKLMDDFIDRRLDAVGGVTTWASVVGDGVLPYAMFTLAVAMLISGRLAGTLFLAAYTLGMAHDLRRKLPSGLEGWHESVLALSLGALLGGVGRMVASLAVLTFVQCVDDVVDDDADRVAGQPVVGGSRWPNGNDAAGRRRPRRRCISCTTDDDGRARGYGSRPACSRLAGDEVRALGAGTMSPWLGVELFIGAVFFALLCRLRVGTPTRPSRRLHRRVALRPHRDAPGEP